MRILKIIKVIKISSNKVYNMVLLLMFFYSLSFAQLWEHYYPMNFYDIYGSSIIQTYDQGYLISTWNTGGQRSRINKLDIDGNIIWSKAIFCQTGYEAILDVCETSDGGVILSGGSSCYDPAGAAFIMRLNSCGEFQWLKEFGTYNDYDRIDRVIPLSDGNYLAAASFLGVGTINRVGLIKFDIAGNIIWSGDYTHHNSPALNDIIESSDSSIYITGYTYVADPGFINPVKIRTHLIKIDSDGSEIWEVPFGLNDSVLSLGINSVELTDGSLLTLSVYRHPYWNLKYWNYLIRSDTSGQELWKKFMSDSTDLSEWGFGLVKLSDTTAIILCNVSYSHNFNTIEDYRLKAIKIDMDGNLLDSAQFGSGGNTYGMRAIVNNEGNVLVCGIRRFGNQTGPFAIKIRSDDLQIDTLMNISLTYDSLCPFPMVSDTILYDTTFVGITEPFQVEINLKLFPNPTTGDITIEYYLENVGSGLLEVRDLSGKLLKTIRLDAGYQSVSFSMSTFRPGMYMVKIFGDNKFIKAERLCLMSE
jgi:hypothetical protein